LYKYILISRRRIYLVRLVATTAKLARRLMHLRNGLTLAVATLIGSLALLLVACGGDDDSDVTVIGGAAESASPGVVEDKPEGATEVDVTLREWEVSAATKTVPAGEIYFLVNNVGPEDAHEFVIVRSDLDPGDLPNEDGEVEEDEVEIVDEIEPFAPGSSASIAVNLTPGKYVLICNVHEVEEDDGEIENHYQLGMRTAFTVE
jgi:uncharacterized cupredoxin-like copper-binding protein